jgi:mannan endo-1,6-alpha-mannosidase
MMSSQISQSMTLIASIRSAASTIAYGLLKYYQNNATDTPPEKVGLLQFPPYYWWESGAMWAGLIDYHSYTKDSSYVNSTIQALMAQRGPKNDFIVSAHRGDEISILVSWPKPIISCD